MLPLLLLHRSAVAQAPQPVVIPGFASDLVGGILSGILGGGGAVGGGGGGVTTPSSSSPPPSSSPSPPTPPPSPPEEPPPEEPPPVPTGELVLMSNSTLIVSNPTCKYGTAELSVQQAVLTAAARNPEGLKFWEEHAQAGAAVGIKGFLFL
ncbi:hypothetical protein PLESTB_001618800 [Pleodorina starrii]|uniref:Uncharacterized protein n=1 Tax=Pleodorina starrii TaxID=330485 RepID=A0A9W6BYK1_9CHLO|nr:hypothetical protein PLESTM_001892200 [Pleodorina starrii]GLC60483.1 hypothetical protein PLESTB_001618800 [Pleodorina starrii]GLC77255.1 hypothetical protein PLESTF_001905000 [Pleodorina starrii]